MVMNSKRDYLNAIWERYQKADKNTKSLILDEICLNCGHHRKHALRLLSQKSHLKRQIPKQKSGPKPIYHTPDLLKVLKRIWFATDQMCSKNLQAALPLWRPFYEQQYDRVPIWVKTKLIAMSPSSINRLLKQLGSDIKPKDSRPPNGERS